MCFDSGTLQTVQKRGAAVIAARKLSSAVSAAKAAGDHMHDIWHGTLTGQFVSMGVISDGSYGAPKDVIFSFPVTIENKEWKIVQVSHTCLMYKYFVLSLPILPIDHSHFNNISVIYITSLFTV
jgi:malate/lactate dehydrogenase